MSCPETKKSLSGFLDGTLSPAETEEVAAHLAECTACRAELAELRRIDELMAGFADPPVDEERLASLWSRVEDQLGAEPADEEQAAATAFASGTPIVMTSTASGQPRWLVPTLAAAGVAIVAVFVITLMLVLSPERHHPPPTKTASAGAAMAADAMGADAMGADAMGADAMNAMGADAMGADAMGADAMGADAMGADAMSAMGSDMGSDTMAASSRRRRRRRGSYSVSRGMSSASRRSMHSGSSSRSTMKPAMARAMSSGGSSLQDLLRRAGGSMGGSSSGMSASSLPKRLSMGQIRKGVYRIIGSARACFNRYRVPGKCYVRVTISGGSGRVTSASIKGSFKGTPTGRCVARAFRRARFKKFSSGSQSFTFPLIFR